MECGLGRFFGVEGLDMRICWGFCGILFSAVGYERGFRGERDGRLCRGRLRRGPSTQPLTIKP
jgi:hypothetical protein